MELSFSTQGERSIAAVAGQVDAASAPTLIDQLTSRIADGATQLVLDLAGLDYTSSAGLRALLTAVKQARAAGGDVRLAGVQDRVARVLEMSGFSAIIRSYPSVDDAIGSFET